MGDEILNSIPIEERNLWNKSTWYVAMEWSDGTGELAYDHRQHVHRDQIEATLTLEGSGTIAKIPRLDISGMSHQEVYDQADSIDGYIYQAAPGELMIINGVHHPSGGLHAAPQNNSSRPERLIIFVSIEKPVSLP
jgi:hypothetical protein